MSMTYSIEGTNVNDRTDWKSDYIPGGPQSKSFMQIPGIASRLVKVGPTMPPTIIVTGFLEFTDVDMDTARTSLRDELDTQRGYESDGVKTVVTGADSYSNCYLESFRTMGSYQPVFDETGTGVKLRIPVRYVWVQMTEGVQA